MGGSLPIDMVRAEYENLFPPEGRVPDWDERWKAVIAYVDSFTVGQTSGLVISDEQKITLATADYTHHIQEVSERLGFQQEISMAGLKGLMLINGGAIVGLLTFIGNASPQFEQLTLGKGMIAFVIGLAANVLAYLFGYYAQGVFMNMAYIQARDDQRAMVGLDPTGKADAYLGKGSNILLAAVAAAITSLVSFGAGVYFVADSFFSAAAH